MIISETPFSRFNMKIMAKTLNLKKPPLVGFGLEASPLTAPMKNMKLFNHYLTIFNIQC